MSRPLHAERGMLYDLELLYMRCRRSAENCYFGQCYMNKEGACKNKS
jgi:hypothetical protein